MQILRAADVPVTERDRVFRASRGRAIVFVLLLAGLATMLAWLGWRRGSALSLYLLGALVFWALILGRLVLARFRPSKWLVRGGDGGLYIKFRPFLNHHFPPDNLTVMLLAFVEIL